MAVLNMYHYGKAVPAGAVNIMRESVFGNPYRIGVHGNRDQVVAKYEEYLAKRLKADEVFKEQVRGLYGKDLCCCCAPQKCHGDVLERVAAELQEEHEREQLEELQELFGPIQD